MCGSKIATEDKLCEFANAIEGKLKLNYPVLVIAEAV